MLSQQTLYVLIQSQSRRTHTIHYSDAMMSAMASQITGVSIVQSTVCSGAHQRKHQSSASLALCAGNSPVNSPHKGQVTRKMLPFDDVIVLSQQTLYVSIQSQLRSTHTLYVYIHVCVCVFDYIISVQISTVVPAYPYGSLHIHICHSYDACWLNEYTTAWHCLRDGMTKFYPVIGCF